MGDANNIASVIKSLKSFDGRGSYREWASDTIIMIFLTHRDVYEVMQGAWRPGSPAAASTATPPQPVFSDMNTDPAGQIRRWDNACQDLYSILHLMTAGSAKLLMQTYEGESGGPGNGQEAWQALKDKYACGTHGTGQDPDGYFILLDQRRARLAENEKVISDERFEDIMLQGITSDLRLYPQHQQSQPELWTEGHAIHNASYVYRQPVSQGQAKGRGTWGGRISPSRLLRLQESLSVFNCNKPGHRKSECLHLKDESSVPAAAGGAKTKWCPKHRSSTDRDAECHTKNKWCSKHRSTTHSDAECKGQWNKRHDTSGNVAKHSTESPPTPTVPEVELGGFSFVATPRTNKAPQPDTLLLLVDSGSSDHYFEDTIFPGLENLMFSVEMLETPRNNSTAGNNTLLGTRTGVLPGTVVDKDGRKHSVQIPGVIVSGMGRNLFSSKKAVEQGRSTSSRLRPAASAAG